MEEKIEAFVRYMTEQFPEVFNNHFAWEWLRNLIIYAYRHRGHTKDSARRMIEDILPQVTPEEVEQFLPALAERDFCPKDETFRGESPGCRKVLRLIYKKEA